MRRIVAIIFLFFATLALPALSQTGDDELLDSLIAEYHGLAQNDTNKLRLCNDIAQFHYNVDSTIMWANRLMMHARAMRDVESESRAYEFLEWAYFFFDDFQKCINTCHSAIYLCDSCDLRRLSASHYYMLASSLKSVNDYRQAERFYDSTLRIMSDWGDTLHLSETIKAMAEMYSLVGAYDLSLQNLKKAMHIDSVSGNNTELCKGLLRSAEVLKKIYRVSFSDADINRIIECKRLLVMASRMEEPDMATAALIDHHIVDVLFYETMHYNYSGKRRINVLDSMYHLCLDQSLVCKFSSSYESHLLKAYSWVCYNIICSNLKTAKYSLDSLSACVSDNLGSLYNYYKYYYIMAGNLDSAMYYSDKFAKNTLDYYSPADFVHFTQKRDQIEFDNTMKSLDDARKAQAEEERFRRIWLIVMLAFAVVVAVFAAVSYYRKRNNNIILSEDNKQISDSINYASLIQQAALPGNDLMQELFHEYFVIFRPLHTVAGDFYWASRVGRYDVLVCADCTGHGVPGAFVSMLGISLLNEVTSNVSDSITASEILDSMREKLMRALNQDLDAYERGLRTNMDGMDLAMVMIDRKEMKLQYAGAYRPLWIWRNGELLQFKHDKMPIGIYIGKDRHFTNHVIDICPGDALYMFSDGIPDQFGYTDNDHYKCKHFSTKRLAELITELGALPMAEQKDRMETAIDTWKNGYKQLDDNILIGVRI